MYRLQKLMIITQIRKYAIKEQTYGINQVWHDTNPQYNGVFIFYVE